MRLFDPVIALKIREWAECQPCKVCGAVLLQGMPLGFCCRSFAHRVQSQSRPPIDEELLQRLVRLAESNANFAQILDRDLRPVLQHACVSFSNAGASNLFIFGISYALDTCCEFRTSVYAVFDRRNRGLSTSPGDVQEIIALVLSRNETLQGYLRDRLNSAPEIATVSMNEPDQGMNLAIFNAEGHLLKDHEMEVLRNSSQPEKLSQFHLRCEQFVCPLICWNRPGHCGFDESEKLQGSTMLIRKVLTSFILSSRDHFVYQLNALREEFICAVSGRLVDLTMACLSRGQKRCFAREDAIRGESSDSSPKEYGLRTFIHPSLTDSDK
jgi:hypothetical protein